VILACVEAEKTCARAEGARPTVVSATPSDRINDSATRNAAPARSLRKAKREKKEKNNIHEKDCAAMPLRGVEKRGEESGEVFFEVVARLLDREKGKEGSVARL
jgi:hypothetical protein